jgi:hypothetical protein
MKIDNTLAALAIGQRFAPVYPSRNGRPQCAHGVHDASRDPERIKALWRSCPDANISVAMGRANGFVGLDVDMKGGRDGKASLAALESEHGPLPPTPHYSTPSDGLGYLFKYSRPEIRSRFDFRPGLELHSDGAGMTLPPSRKNGRPYSWIVTPRDVPFADLPAWLFAAANPPPPPPRQRQPIRGPSLDRMARYVARAIEDECAAVAATAPNSGRNLRLFIGAAKLGELVGADLVARDLVERELEAAAEICGLASEDGWRAVRATIASGLERGIRQPREVVR